MTARKKNYIAPAILASLAILFGIWSLFNPNQPYASKKYTALYSNNDLNISTYKTNAGQVSVNGKNSIVIDDYLTTILNNTFDNMGFKVDYQKEPTIQELNKIFEEHNLVEKRNFKIYSEIYTILQNSPNQVENTKIVNNLISNGFKLSPLTKAEVETELAKTTIKGDNLTNLNKQVLELKTFFTSNVV